MADSQRLKKPVRHSIPVRAEPDREAPDRLKGQQETAPEIVQEVLETPGQALDERTRRQMEARFGHDFSRVRVHADTAAAESAEAVDALAYTVGRHVVFSRGAYAPGTARGRLLLSHELTHVVQQPQAAAPVGPIAVDPVHSPGERHAQHAARAIAAGTALETQAGGYSRPVLQRTAAGVFGGGLLGAVAGAGLGFLAGGPIGALIGGLVGGIAGAFAGDALTAERRPLTSDERREAETVFGDSLNYDPIRVASAPLMSVGGYARTLPNVIYFPAEHFRDPDPIPLLIHELTHCWQYQHGRSVATTLFHALFSSYDFGGERGLVRARAEGKHFTDFNTEQQGDILRTYYIRRRAGQDVSAWEPFVEEVRNHGRSGSARPSSGTTSP